MHRSVWILECLVAVADNQGAPLGEYAGVLTQEAVLSQDVAGAEIEWV